MNNKHFYLTTTLPYVNSDPHVGFALEIVQADIIARYKKLMGYEVFFNTGTDEHGVKVYSKAIEVKKDTQAYADEYAERFRNLKDALNLDPEIHFIRTTDAKHKAAAQEFWRRCNKAGDIYKKNYSIKYCIGCELEKTDSELVDGKCPLHPNLEIEIRNEENYFFAFSKYGDRLISLYDSNPDFLLPAYRLNEMRVLIKEKGLEDFSISRLKSKMPWGVPVPDDEEQVMYVWFDALVSYISTIDWPQDARMFNKWWPVTQFAGKDQVRQQAAMWQAMLMSVGLPASKQIIIHGFINSGGQKMSKSLGNVIDPYKVVEEYGVDALRYYLAREVSPFEDSDFTMEKFKESYNANLANGIGNLTSRIMKMAETNLTEPVTIPEMTIPQNWKDALEKFEINKAADIVWAEISALDAMIQETQPFKLVKTDKEKGSAIIQELLVRLYTVARMLNPILPETSAAIKALVKSNKVPEKPLFLRKE
jgi:methionyl-tRNA synthetase